MNLASDSPRELATPLVAQEPSGPDPELSATVEGGWRATLPEGQVDAGTTAPGPMAITNIDSLPAAGEVSPTLHPPGMVTTMRPGMMTTALGTLHDGVGKGSRASTLTPGTIIDGKYRLEKLLGKGGMGIVWRAEHAHLHGSVAIKFLLDRFRAKVQVIERFRQEAMLMGELGHPNIVRVYDISPASADMPYITMELLDQGSLREYLKRSGGHLPPDEACELMDGVLSALIAAHKRGIVHRDIKPDNLMLATVRSFETDMNEDQLKILDFGASLLLDDSSDINNAEGLMGTPYYMSPEQASGASLDQRSDLYSTAVVLYESISGKLPHTAEDVHSLVYSIATEEPTPIATHAPNLPRPFREFFVRALSRDPGARFQTAEEMRQAMRGLSRKLAGKNRNTALHMAAGDTGPLQALPTARPDSQPLRGFREALDDPTGSSRNGQVPQPTTLAGSERRPFWPLAALTAGLALAPALLIQALRHGGLGQASGVDTAFAWAGCAGLAVLLVWQLRQRR
ncbi:serine/threonine-protein kinase [Nannocystis sp.]|uniref:serine/threonine-protein kinase n=1 Tax=Nannocystis sp. TaxID=1962667 RepID=UPI002420F7BE|nr:serine/threonine-protein kinase [Nannocystis sp.]MBK9757717.1 serine/threonine protein kinase [Nannocystis sp.]